MKRKAALISFALAALVSAAVAGPSSAATDPGPAGRPADRAASDYVPGELLVRFETARDSRQTERAARDAVATVGGRVTKRFDHAAPGLRRVVLDKGVDVQDAVAELNARGDVAYAEPNYRIHATGIPNDSRFGEQYGLHNTGQSIGGVTGTNDADIDAPEAWNVTTGSSNVVVAVLDTGIAYDHPDLAPNMWVNSREVAGNGIDDDGNGYVDDRRGWDAVDEDGDPVDEQGHGTHVAGTIGARGGNDTAGGGTTDVAGVAWNVRLMPVRVLNEVGLGNNVDLIEAIDYARANGARIANLSLSSWNFSAALQDAIETSPNITFVVAAGNDGGDADEVMWTYPCIFPSPNIVCVAATDNRDRLAGYSNWGPVSVDVAAPGTNVLSTKAYHRVFFDDFESANSQWTFGGTPNTWARTTDLPFDIDHGGTWLTDSPNGNYPTGTDNWARTSAVNLTGMRDCTVQFFAHMQTESLFGDFVAIEASNSPTGPWVQAGTAFNGLAQSGFDQRMPDQFNGDAQVYVRIRLHEDGEFETGDGIFVDDFAVQCAGRYTPASYEYLSGTSMATPHVSGVAALVLARNPAFSTAQIKGRLLSSVDTKSSLTGKTVSGGRINAFKAVNTSTPNQPPTANASPDKVVRRGANVTLSGSGTDPEGQPLRYSWTQVFGPPVTLRNATTATASYTAPTSTGTSRFRLTVTDAQGASSVDEVDITVSATAPK